MRTDKQIKEELRKRAQQKPEQFYPVGVLRQEGFSRKQCASCGLFFWAVTSSEKCGNPECSGGWRFIGNSPARRKLDYIKVWQEFARLFKKRGYTPIRRYPVTARWRDDTDFVQASIYDFQPYVVSGEVEPPANPLVVPQFCLRFNDIDNVGITGSHYTGFVMIGQHAFLPEERWNQETIFSDIHAWLTQGLGLPNEEISFHEDAWAGGGNCGPSMEYFSRGLELGNQVYMLYQVSGSGFKDLPLKVCDMGMGHERNAWFSLGKATSYETTFPTVMEKLRKSAGMEPDDELIKKFLPYSSFLNVDEIEDADKVWQDIASKIGYDVAILKESVLRQAALYSIGEHTRTLLVALSDGALPSNVGGGYNLRVILRRTLGFIDKYQWDIDIPALIRLHARYLKPLFPELSKQINHVNTVLDIERQRYAQTREKSRQLVGRMLRTDITEQKLIELYDSYGIDPEVISEEAAKLGKAVHVPETFYAQIAGLHKQAEQEAKHDLLLDGLPDTALLFYEDPALRETTARVLRIIGQAVILDRTCFYPRGGGQEPDLGSMQSCRVYDVEKIRTIVVHHVEQISFKEGDEVHLSIDPKRREQLTAHHTATHLINAAAREVLGDHAFQAGAFKGEHKAHIDIAHYNPLTEDELERIEARANKAVQKRIPSKISWVRRNVAEERFGFSIYQGGAVPGKELRIVEIPNVDAEACGGTHVANTKDVGEIIVTKSERIQDGIVRVEFVAGEAAAKERERIAQLHAECAQILGTPDITKGAAALFEEWKRLRKDMEAHVKDESASIIHDLRGKIKDGLLVASVPATMNELREISRALSADNRVVLLFGTGDAISVFGSAGRDTGVDIGAAVVRACERLGGRGGGAPHIGQGIGTKKERLAEVIESVRRELHGARH